MSKTSPLACRGLLLWAGLSLLSACGRYADFTLPVLIDGDPHMTYTWESHPGPVLERGEGWESHDVLNPSVMPASNSGAPYLNLYSGFDGRTWRTGLATSGDGIHWQRQGIVLAPDPGTWEGDYVAANGTAVLTGREFWYWYQAGPRGLPRIGMASSSDKGRTWRKEPAPVLAPGPRGS